MTRQLLRILAPLVLILAVAGGYLVLDPLRGFGGATPPVETLTVERTQLDGDGIDLLVRADGSAPLEIVQVQVDGAYWAFTQDPPGPIRRLATARLAIPYPWVLGETHHLTILTKSGVTFEHTIDVAVPTPAVDGATLRSFTLIGLFVGVVPVALGMLFYPALRAGGSGTFVFALALTLGLLAFLLVDTLGEALELAAESAPGLHAQLMVWLLAALSTLALLALGRRGSGLPRGTALATAIAFGIGMHNLGEGLAIAAAFTSGATALGAFLVVGFTLHNVTEGVGIVAPLLDERPRLSTFAGLAALAGLPAVLGMWLGAFAFTPQWAALALAIGAGAILQVIIEVGGLLWRRATAGGTPALSATTLSGMALGIALMYGTALLVAA